MFGIQMLFPYYTRSSCVCVELFAFVRGGLKGYALSRRCFVYYIRCCSVLQCVAVCCRVVQSVAVCFSVLQCVAVCCSVLQCVAVCLSTTLGPSA